MDLGFCESFVYPENSLVWRVSNRGVGFQFGGLLVGLPRFRVVGTDYSFVVRYSWALVLTML